MQESQTKQLVSISALRKHFKIFAQREQRKREYVSHRGNREKENIFRTEGTEKKRIYFAQREQRKREYVSHRGNREKENMFRTEGTKKKRI